VEAKAYLNKQIAKIDKEIANLVNFIAVRAHIESPAERELGSRQFPTLRVNRVT
jgi:hypothetical protein